MNWICSVCFANVLGFRSIYIIIFNIVGKGMWVRSMHSQFTQLSAPWSLDITYWPTLFLSLSVVVLLKLSIIAETV